MYEAELVVQLLLRYSLRVGERWDSVAVVSLKVPAVW